MYNFLNKFCIIFPVLRSDTTQTQTNTWVIMSYIERTVVGKLFHFNLHWIVTIIWIFNIQIEYIK